MSKRQGFWIGVRFGVGLIVMSWGIRLLPDQGISIGTSRKVMDAILGVKHDAERHLAETKAEWQS